MKLKGTPLPDVDGVAEKAKVLVAPACTPIGAELPVVDGFTVSLTTITGLKKFPVLRVAVNIPMPLINIESGGKLPIGSVVEKCTVPV